MRWLWREVKCQLEWFGERNLLDLLAFLFVICAVATVIGMILEALGGGQ